MAWKLFNRRKKAKIHPFGRKTHVAVTKGKPRGRRT